MLLQMQEQQGFTPPALERKPELDRYQEWLVGEFRRLSRDRTYTDNGPMHLSTGTIRTYYDCFRMHNFDFDNFYLWMTTIDDIWMDQVTAKREKERATDAAKSKKPPERPGRR